MIKKGDLIQIGKIIKLSGHSGELIVSGPSISEIKNFDVPVFIELAGELVPFYIEEMNPINSEKSVVKFQYVLTSRKAESLQGKTVYLVSSNEKKDKLKFNLIGFTVVDEFYGEVGELIFIDENIRNPLMIVKSGSKEVMIPYREEFITGIDKKEQVLLVKCPTGLIEIYLGGDEEE